MMILFAGSMLASESAINTVALTLYGEAAGEPNKGKLAVASVIWHRAAGKPSKLVSICKAKKQFSCWNKSKPVVRKDQKSQEAWKYCRLVAKDMVEGQFVPTLKASHYHADYVKPKWAYKMQLVKVISRHRFYWGS
jgi:spore germination cell wall hydrolase CwlJ-like protein